MVEVTNAWGEEPETEKKDRYWVPEDERRDDDDGDGSNALTEETGDDMGDES